MLTALGTIGALDVDALPPAAAGARSPPPLGLLLPPGDEPRAAAGPVRRGPRRAASRPPSTRTGTRRGRWDGGVLELLRAADVFLPNAAEARRIAGIDDVEEAALALARTGAAGRVDGGPTIAVKLGADGALACRAGRTARPRPGDARSTRSTRPAPAIRSTPGSCAPGSTARTCADCLELGAACGALSTRAAGGVDGQPTLAEARGARRLAPHDGRP